MENKIKWISYEDEYTGYKIYAIDGFQYGGNIEGIMVRIFGEKVEEYRGSGTKVTKYYPQIDNEEREEQIIIGEYRYLKDAKVALIKEFEKYRLNNFQLD